MSTSASLDSSNVQLQAGEQVVIPLQIRNNGEIVEGYRIEVVGPPAAWSTVEPATVSLYPGSSTTATVAFHPPRTSTVPAGELQFGVVVTPTEHPDEAVVPEGVLEVLPFLDTTAELLPRTSQGRRYGRHQVAVDNRGNVPVTALLTATDPTGQLRGTVSPQGLTVNPGEAAFADVRVRPAKSIWRGAPLTSPFVVEVAPQDSPAVQLDGTYVQQPILPPWFLKALLAALALLIALVLLWFLLLKPAIKSSAEDAVAPQTKQAADNAAAAKKDAAAADQAAKQATGSAGTATKAKNDTQAMIKNANLQKSTPFNDRLSVVVAKGATDTAASQPVPANQTMQVTDLVMSNPQGDAGRLVLRQDTKVLFDMALENFRDIDYHFVAPIVLTKGEQLVMQVQCRQPGTPPGETAPPNKCDIGTYFGGDNVKPKG